jgi:hypothetical protein
MEKVRKYASVEENKELRQEILQSISSENSSVKLKLEKFVRYDLLGS